MGPWVVGAVDGLVGAAEGVPTIGALVGAKVLAKDVVEVRLIGSSPV